MKTSKAHHRLPIYFNKDDADRRDAAAVPNKVALYQKGVCISLPGVISIHKLWGLRKSVQFNYVRKSLLLLLLRLMVLVLILSLFEWWSARSCFFLLYPVDVKLMWCRLLYFVLFTWKNGEALLVRKFLYFFHIFLFIYLYSIYHNIKKSFVTNLWLFFPFFSGKVYIFITLIGISY